MADQGVERRLAAILAADVVGYSRLMEADEEGTHARLKALRKALIEPALARYHGRIVKLTGDGALVEFASAVDAVKCAVEVQKGIAGRNGDVPTDRQLWFRVGINIGDIIIEDDDIYGDGVNIAARLEGLAEPGGICIARNVYNQVKNKLAFGFEPMGEHRVKNIAEPVEVYRVLPEPGAVAKAVGLKRSGTLRLRWAALSAAAVVMIATGGASWWYRGQTGMQDITGAAADGAVEAKPALSLPDKPSIAVLPFDNLSGEERYERLADGITEDIITDLSRFPELFVIARNSTFFYKDQPTDVRQIARELGVQYVLEGSLQADKERVRITAQLIDAITGNHEWSERYERPLDDVFAVQDEVTQQIVGTLGGYWGRLAQVGRERARRKPPENLEAYDLYLLGVEHKHRHTKEDNQRAQELLNRAIALDPNFARAYVVLAQSHLNDAAFGFGEDPARSLRQFRAAAKKAVALDDTDAMAHLVLGSAYFSDNQVARGAAEFNRALELGANDADVLAVMAYNRPTKMPTGKEDVELVRQAMRLNPHYPEWYFYALGYAAFHGRQYEEAVAALGRFMNHPMIDGPLYSALSHAQLGQEVAAAAAAAKALELVPDFAVETLMENDAFRDPGVIEHFLESARKAGLPLCATEEQLAAYPNIKRVEECEQQRASG